MIASLTLNQVHLPKRRNKPVPGDISERAQIETGILIMGRKMVANFEKYGESPPAYLGGK